MKADPTYVRLTPPAPLSIAQRKEITTSLLNFNLPSCDKKATAFAKTQMAEFTRKTLASHKVEMYAEGMPMYLSRMESLWKDSLVRDGEEYGVETALAASCAATQATLKAKKMSGSKSMGGSLAEMGSLLEAQENVAQSNMVVHFNMRMTKRMIIDLKATFVEVFLKDLIDNNKQVSGKLSTKKGDGFLPISDCHYIYEANNSSLDLKTEPLCIRFYLTKSLLFHHRITPSEIARKMEDVGNDDEDSESHYRVFIGSSFKDAFIDIIWIRKHDSKNREEIELKLRSISLEDSKVVSLKGIPGITAVVPMNVRFTSMFSKRQITKKEREDHKLGPLVVALQIEQDVVSHHNYPPLVRYKEAFEDKGLEIIGHITDKDTHVLATIFVDGLEKGEDINDLLLDQEYWYALLRGTNMNAICRIPWVDSSRVTCNCLPKMRRAFGIEATFAYSLYALYNNMKESGSSDVQSRYILMIMRDMCRTGDPYGISYCNNKNKGTDYVSSVGMSRAKDELISAASRKAAVGSTTVTMTTITSGTIHSGEASLPVIDLNREKVLKAVRAQKKKETIAVDFSLEMVKEEEELIEEITRVTTQNKSHRSLRDKMVWENLLESKDSTETGEEYISFLKPAEMLRTLIQEERVMICRVDNDEVHVDTLPRCISKHLGKTGTIPLFIHSVLSSIRNEDSMEHMLYIQPVLIEDFVVPQLGRTYIPEQ